ncbi:hypothetical protein [Lacinutrix undariae]
MKIFKTFVVLFLIGMTSQTLYAQQDFAVIEKNVNVRAKSLLHDLNNTKDTLILKGDRKIGYISAIDEDSNRVVDTYIGKKDFKLPLNTLKKGKYIFVVIQQPLQIVFVVKVLKDAVIITEGK